MTSDDGAKLTSGQGKKMTTTEDYFQLPDGHAISWIDWLKPRLRYSFKSCTEGRQEYTLNGPFIASVFGEYHNLYLKGRGFYAAGRILDRQYLDKLMREYRRVSAHDQLRSKFRSLSSESSNRHHWWKNHAAMEISKLYDALTSGFVDRDRFPTSNIYLGVEMCLKAVCTHANFREHGTWKFPKTHDMIQLWDRLPQGLQNDIVQASVDFKKEYSAYRDTVDAILKSATRQATGTISMTDDRKNSAYVQHDQKLAHACSEKPYSLFFNENDQLNVEDLSDDWLLKSMSAIRDLNYHRYGEDGISTYDPLPTGIVNLTHWLGKLFYEHLFPGETHGDRKVRPLVHT